VRYTSIRPDDAPLREAMKAVAAARRGFGYRRIHVMLDRQGIVMNQKKLRRLYREEKLQVRRRGGRKRALGTRRPMLIPDRANTRWSLDFVSDTFTDGRRFRVLAVVDDYTRECLALIADTSLSGLRVVRELDATTSRRASRCKTPSSRASTGASGTNASTTRCSRHSPKPAALSPHGRRTTTTTDPTRHSATCRQPSLQSNLRWKKRPHEARNET
jgi:transposase InsO family protein